MSAEDLLSRISCTLRNYMLAALYLLPIKLVSGHFRTSDMHQFRSHVNFGLTSV